MYESRQEQINRINTLKHAIRDYLAYLADMNEHGENDMSIKALNQWLHHLQTQLVELNVGEE